ncbi:hypothetical protein LUZ60_000798 [Juncus effusus]|nr:hypothetical protein LUZ60_000798 [Juncus effusus]
MTILISGSRSHEIGISDQAPESVASVLEEIAELLMLCGPYVGVKGEKKKPNMLCCQAIKKFDFTFICQLIPPIVEKVVSMEKLAYVAEKCHNPIDPGTKCGSYIVPAPTPAAPGPPTPGPAPGPGDDDGKQ